MWLQSRIEAWRILSSSPEILNKRSSPERMVVQSLSRLTVCDLIDCSTPGFPVPSLSPRVYSNSCLLSQWCHPIISSSVPLFSSCLNLSLFPSIKVFSSELALRIKWPKYWSRSFNISPFNEYSGLISFRMDWFDLLAVQGTLKSLLRHHSSKASILQCEPSLWSSSHPYTATGKTTALTTWAFVGKVMSLLFNMLSRLVITFLPRSVSNSCDPIGCSLSGSSVHFPGKNTKVGCCYYFLLQRSKDQVSSNFPERESN